MLGLDDEQDRSNFFEFARGFRRGLRLVDQLFGVIQFLLGGVIDFPSVRSLAMENLEGIGGKSLAIRPSQVLGKVVTKVNAGLLGQIDRFLKYKAILEITHVGFKAEFV